MFLYLLKYFYEAKNMQGIQQHFARRHSVLAKQTNGQNTYCSLLRWPHDKMTKTFK